MEATNNTLAPLLSTCKVLRTLALERVCNKCQLEINDDPDCSLLTFNSWPTCKQQPLANTLTKYVRRVYLDVHYWDILNGDASEILKNASWTDCAFPSATKMNVAIKGNYLGGDFYTLEAKTHNIVQFVGDINAIMPHIATVKVEIDNSMKIEEKSNETSSLLNSLVNMLYKDSKSKYMKIYCDEFRIGLLPNSVSNLTHIVARTSYNTQATFMLLHKSAPTVQSLEIRFDSAEEMAHLVCDDSGCPIAYPGLSHLTLIQWSVERLPSKPSTSSNQIPFPRLRSLKIDMEHPFGDNTLFRGNCGTLESLQMALDCITINMLKRNEVFAAGKYAKLRNIYIRSIDQESEVESIPDYIYQSFVLKMSPKAQIFTDQEVMIDQSKVALFCNSPNLADLRVLNLPSLALHMTSLVPLLKGLRRLERLECSSLVGDLDIDADCMHAAHFPLASRLRLLSLTSYDDEHNDAFGCIMLLALVCPVLTHCRMSYGWRESFNSFVQGTVETAPYSLCRDRLMALKYINEQQ
ncbi:hypothetical protein GGI04_003292 [Coemansia thaxteri]|nr:hypothetical protein GGI04_003292 [Coemansia thaxteri]